MSFMAVRGLMGVVSEDRFQSISVVQCMIFLKAYSVPRYMR